MLQTVLGSMRWRLGGPYSSRRRRIGQRLVRAKTKIRQARIAFEIPTPDQIPERLEAVLNAIYAAYGNSWEDASGADQRITELGQEAIWLARVLREQIPDDPEVRGLLALMLYCEARRPARRSADGRFVPLSDRIQKTGACR
jgi:RNA polymerase sigma-70 factor (ECF subfamily)